MRDEETESHLGLNDLGVNDGSLGADLMPNAIIMQICILKHLSIQFSDVCFFERKPQEVQFTLDKHLVDAG